MGRGAWEVYDAGIALNIGYKAFYYYDNNLSTGTAIIQKMFKDLFDHFAEDKSKRNGYKLYAHNLGRFYPLFILRSLASAGYDLKS